MVKQWQFFFLLVSLSVFLSFIFILLRYNLKPEQGCSPWVFPLPVTHCCCLKWLFPCRAMPLTALPAPIAGPIPTQRPEVGKMGSKEGGLPNFQCPSQSHPVSHIPEILSQPPHPSSPTPGHPHRPPRAPNPSNSSPLHFPGFSQ